MPRWRGIGLLLGAIALSLAVLWLRLHGRVAPSPPPIPTEKARAAPPQVLRLRPGSGETRDLTAGISHVYRFDLQAGWLLRVSLEQRGIDLLARVIAPDGAELFQVDSPTEAQGLEEVWIVAGPPGEYRIAVEAPRGKGSYRARIAEHCLASAGDRKNAEAERTYHQARMLAKTGAPRDRLETMFLAAARAWNSLGRHQREADAWDRIGGLCSKAGDWRGARDAYLRSHQLYHEVEARRFEALAAGNLADAWRQEGDLEESRRARTEAVRLWKVLKETKNETVSSNEICQLDHLAGRGEEALECYDRVFESWKALKEPRRQGIVRIDQGTLYTSLGDLSSALDSYREALSLLVGPDNQDARGAALTQLGNAYLRSGSPRAVSRFREALALARKAGDRNGEAAALNGMGLAWQQSGKLGEAALPFRRALALFEQLGDPSAQATVWTNLGWLRLSQGEPLPALEAFQKGLSQAAASGNREAEAAALSGMARAERRRGNWIAARDRIERALEVVESVRAGTGDPSEDASRVGRRGFFVDVLKASYAASKQADYEFLIDLLMERHRLETSRRYDVSAFQAAERARARSLSDALAPRRGERLPAALSMDEVRREVLDGDTVLLEYALGEPRSHLWWVAREGHRSFELPGRHELEDTARRLNELVRHSGRSGALPPARRRSEELSRVLVGPVAHLLDGRRLLVVLPDVLSYVPFEALPDPSVQVDGTAWPVPLVGGREVVRIPSASVLLRLRAQRAGRAPAPGLLAVVGHPVFSPRDDRLPPGVPGGSEVDDLSLLPFAGREVRAIVELARGGEVLSATGFDATRELVLSGALGRYQVLHFLAHGLIDAQRPERSTLVLSRFDRRGRPRPGRLSADEIRDLRFTADLVVLSACETGLGRELRGEGLVGLPHSFLAAGASSVLVSLWRVEDRATSVFMDRFYRELLGNHVSPAAALRAAQLALRRDPRWGAPSYWGGFVLQGDWINKTPPGGSPLRWRTAAEAPPRREGGLWGPRSLPSRRMP